jgi:hypothetical protein
MSATIYNNSVFKSRNNAFPIVENVAFASLISLQISCSGENSVQYEIVSSGVFGVILPGETKELFANSDSITDSLNLTFNGSATVNLTGVIGVGSGGMVGGATAANQVIEINILNGTTPSVFSGQEDTPSVVEVTAAGAQITDKALACSLKFYGTGGTINGVIVESGYTVDFGTNERNEVKGIAYTVPTSPDFQGFKRVLITYVKI